jgi:tRNA-splicing ligase RtcB
MSKPMRLQMAVQRPLYHLAGARSVQQVRERLALYFSDRELAVDRNGVEGRRLLAATAAAMNYGFAFRAAIYAELCSLADRFFGVRGSRLVVDSPHNSIYEEEVDGVPAVVHRHNACRAYPAAKMPAGTAFGDVGQAVLLPGTHRTSSYLCVADEGAPSSLHSACHGAGTVVEMMERTGASRPHPEGFSTVRFRYDGSGPEAAAHLDDAGVDATLDILVSNRIVRPVARMRPVGVLH